VPSSADVTVIVCSRNRADMLREALDAIAETTPAATEVIVVDSASDTDETIRVARGSGVAVTRAGRGLSVARNAGIVTSARPIVVFTDDDCRPTQGWIERLVAHYGEPGVAAVTGRMLDHTVAADAPYERAERYGSPLEGLDAGHGAVMSFRRDVLLRLGGFDEVMGAGQLLAGAEDLDIFVRILRSGEHIVHDETCVVRHANTRVGDAYVELHHGYGLGLGALIGKWLRIDPVLGIRIGWVLVGRTTARLIRAHRLIRGHQGRRTVAADRALLRGIFEGVRAVRRMPIVGERFVPPWMRERVPPLVDEALEEVAA
jgi:glycosyltransferase involved in cell wall biosynthesis